MEYVIMVVLGLTMMALAVYVYFARPTTITFFVKGATDSNNGFSLVMASRGPAMTVLERYFAAKAGLTPTSLYHHYLSGGAASPPQATPETAPAMGQAVLGEAAPVSTTRDKSNDMTQEQKQSGGEGEAISPAVGVGLRTSRRVCPQDVQRNSEEEQRLEQPKAAAEHEEEIAAVSQAGKEKMRQEAVLTAVEQSIEIQHEAEQGR